MALANGSVVAGVDVHSFSEAEVNNFYRLMKWIAISRRFRLNCRSDQNVVQFEVAVNDGPRVQELHSFYQLSEEVFGQSLAERPAIAHQFICHIHAMKPLEQKPHSTRVLVEELSDELNDIFVWIVLGMKDSVNTFSLIDSNLEKTKNFELLVKEFLNRFRVIADLQSHRS